MTSVKGKKHYHRVVFKRRPMDQKKNQLSSSSSGSLSENHQKQEPGQPGITTDEVSSPTKGGSRRNQSTIPEHIKRPVFSTKMDVASMIPDFFKISPPLRDPLNTETSIAQDATIQECLPFLSGENEDFKYNQHGIPHLDRKRHVEFLRKTLRKLPAGYVTADASRPWMFYWVLAGLSTMGEDISGYRERLVSTVRPIQNVTGGFGGGNGQMSHLAPTYAILLSLAVVGGEEALDLIDRKAMWKWLGALKQPDGGFQLSVGGEEDVRGAYCAAVIITLLNLPLDLPCGSPAWSREGDTLLTGLPEWVARCQTFEGGISAQPDGEAHGGYAFCALGCLSILGDPQVIIPEYLDVYRLVSWLSARQYAPEGGFAGRTNKLVDGCYSHWVAGCWPLIEACINGPSSLSSASGARAASQAAPQSSGASLYSREGLIRYILCCCQDQTKRGGLRDKPSHTSDAYHTCYVLAGLSSAQHKWHFNTPATKPESSDILTSPYQWTVEPFIEETQIYDEEDRVGVLHPVFVIPEGVAEETRAYFASKGGF